MSIPDTSRENIVEALCYFDNNLRDSVEWQGWNKRSIHKFAIKYEDKIYPVKETIRNATGFTDFSGGTEANSYLKKRGFTIVQLREETINLKEKISLSKLNAVIRAFDQYRAKDEDSYRQNEYDYKILILDYLHNILDMVHTDPEQSRNEMMKLMIGKDVDKKLIPCLNNLLSFSGFLQRDDFKVFLENIDVKTYQDMFLELFNSDIDIETRFRNFRKKVNDLYSEFYKQRLFAKNKNSKPNFSTNFTGILLAAYDYDEYILYKSTEYQEFIAYLGLNSPGSVEEKYKLYTDVAKFVLEYSMQKGYSVHNLIDAHNLVYMYKNYNLLPEDEVNDPDADDNSNIYEYIEEQCFSFPGEVITNYILALSKKPFVILSGISGTGKTKIGQLVADYLCRNDEERENRVAFISVRPEWTDNSAILGYYNSITEKYEVTPVLKLMLAAQDNPLKSFFIILDEMNIAKVEHYFSDFLSCLESRRIDASGKLKQEPIILHNESEEVTFIDVSGNERTIPQKLNIPSNVFITGTVNIDETTYMFSPKVLDRANTIEFNEVYLEAEEMPEQNEFTLKNEIDLEDMFVDAEHPSTLHYKSFKAEMGDYHKELVRLNNLLSKYNMHFGYRVANEIALYMLNTKKYCRNSSEVLNKAFDLQLLQKVLPKFNGNTSKLEEPLNKILEFAAGRYISTEKKLQRMLKTLEYQGFTSFIE